MCIYVRVCECVRVCVCTCVCIYVCVCVCVYIFVCVCESLCANLSRLLSVAVRAALACVSLYPILSIVEMAESSSGLSPGSIWEKRQEGDSKKEKVTKIGAGVGVRDRRGEGGKC